ncbi:radical SAM protein [Desulfopila aestuarii]|uniref:Radical SAM superfamily protein n=1 Tax=Desulfopila aestuarii DSM 18488 TaxID=1121416 RepID=A0A1M7Y7H8_9BACT|nr:radical SAM protein [Desulfopila aestuarii]SHO48570.1 Radical SAM superfamily protein [Desulfopila aestuarii DSM 18488]
MDYQGNIFRPPSEAYSILLQVTTGCSHNKCTFCGMYKGSRFTIKDDATIMADIDFAARHCRRQNRLFLCDGDALIIPQKRLVAILSAIKEKLPWIERVSSYANTKSIKMKSAEQLEELRQLGLTLAYMGLESGDDVTLKTINKGADSAQMIEMGRKIKAAGIKLSITVLLGIAAKERSQIHATETGRVLSAIDPEFVGALSLMLTPNTPAYHEHVEGKRYLPGPQEMLEELGTMLAATHLSQGLFHANHASNYLPIKARLPEEKEQTLAMINAALGGKVNLKPEYMRAL